MCSSANTITVLKSKWHATGVREIRNEYKILVGHPEGKGSVVRRRCGNDIKMDVNENRMLVCLRVHLLQDRVQ